MIEVELPDGAIAEFPDGTSQDVMRQALQRRFGASSPSTEAEPQAGVLSDVVQSVGAGLRSGAEGLVGMFGDTNKMQGDIAGWAAGKLGASPEFSDWVEAGARRLSPMPMAPSTAEIQSVTTPIVGESYQPETTAGEYAKTIGQFAPAAAAGPGGLARKAAMTAVPAVASETAGQLTKGSEIEPFARTGAALLGGFASAGRAPTLAREAAKDAPTTATLREQTDKLYGALRDADIRYDANEYAGMVQRMAADLRKQGFRKSTADQAYKLVDDLAEDIGKSPDFDDINGLIQSVGTEARAAARAPDGGGRAKALGVIRDHLDDFEMNAAFDPVGGGAKLPPSVMKKATSAARETALRNIKGRVLDRIVDDAETYQSGFEAGIRNGIGNLLRSKRGMQMFKGDERKALLDVAQGGKAVRTLSRFGLDLTRLAGNASFLPTMGAVGATMGAGWPAAAALATAGTAAKLASPALTKRGLDTASAAIRSGKISKPSTMDAVKAQQIQRFVRQMLNYEAGRNAAFGG